MSDVVSQSEVSRRIQQFYEEEWVVGRTRSIQVLRDLLEKIQGLEDKYSIGSIVYAFLGFIGGGFSIGGLVAAPLTLGVSLALTLAGTVLGVLSIFASLVHKGVNVGLIKHYCRNVKMVLDQDVALTNTLVEMIETEFRDVQSANLISNWRLFKDNFLAAKDPFMAAWKMKGIIEGAKAITVLQTTGNLDEAANLVGLGKTIGPPIEAIGVAPRALTSLSILSGFASGIGMVINIGVIAYHVRQLKSDNLCEHSRKLQDEVDRMSTEFERFDTEIRHLLFNQSVTSV